MVLRVGRPTDEEIAFLKPGIVLIGTLGTLANLKLAERLAEAKVTAISMDAIPRITARRRWTRSAPRRRWEATRRCCWRPSGCRSSCPC